MQVFSVPLVERLQQLQAVALGADFHPQGPTFRGRVLVGVLARVKVLGWQLVSIGRVQLELLPVGSGEVVRLWVEAQGAGDGQGCDNLEEIGECESAFVPV